MKTALSPEIKEVVEAVHYRPAISIVMPFEPKMSIKSELNQQLKFAVDKVDREVRKNYKDDLAELVIHKLKKIIKDLNFNTYKKSIAIYVSPVFEKVLYLDIPVEEKIMVDDSFEIRDLLQAKKELHKYMVVVLSGKWSKVYIGNYSSFTKVASHVPDHIAAFTNDVPERVTNFSDPSYRKEVLLEKFLHHTDDGLKFLLQAYPLPVFVMGTKRVLGHFKVLTKNEKSIVGYIHGNYEEASEAELGKALNPYIDNWKKVRMEDLRHQVEKAADAGKLSVGMKEVWKSASQRKGRLLIVEKNFVYTAEHGSSEEVIYKAEQPYTKFSYIKDAVDDVIEKVLEHGGDVEFVDKGKLREYGHIALIQYY
ncbi:MAG: hypothetical protein JNN00_17400 [Chitinophagaceae bacterium]|nr:hypothetical protein [Chitinophagaceae bacterium]